MKAKAKAIKTGKVLATLLLERAFGNRPATLIGYSLGALVISTALEHLSTLPPSQTSHLIESVYLFGLPRSNDPAAWTSMRRVVCGRLVNGYSKGDWVLSVLGRVSSDSGMRGFNIAGLAPVAVQGVENVEWEVGGHLGWRGNVGVCLKSLGVDVDGTEVERQHDEGEKQVK